MALENIIERMQLDDLDDEQKEIAELIGIDNYKKLVGIYGGISIYIPKIDSFAATRRNELICNEFTGSNFRELAQKYGITEVWVRAIVADKFKEIREAPVEGQISLFNANAS